MHPAAYSSSRSLGVSEFATKQDAGRRLTDANAQPVKMSNRQNLRETIEEARPQRFDC